MYSVYPNFVLDNYVFALDERNGGIASGWPSRIEFKFNGLNEGKLNAALTRPNGKTFFFKVSFNPILKDASEVHRTTFAYFREANIGVLLDSRLIAFYIQDQFLNIFLEFQIILMLHLKILKQSKCIL